MTRRHYYASRRFTKLMKCRAGSGGAAHFTTSPQQHDDDEDGRTLWLWRIRSDEVWNLGLDSFYIDRLPWRYRERVFIHTRTDGRIDVASGPDPVASLSEKSLCLQPLFFLLFYLFKRRRRRRILMMITCRDFGGWLGGLWDAATNVEWGGRNQFPFLWWLSI